VSWKNINYKSVELLHPASLEFIDALKVLYANGDVILRCFEPQDATLFKQAQFKDLQGIDHIIKTFLLSNSVMATLSEVIKMTEKDVQSLSYSWQGAFEFEGALTQTLLAGGAYIRFKGTEDDARILSRKFVDAILPDGRLSASVFKIDGAWTDWYYDVAWDKTFIVYDRTGCKWSVFCATDTD
jgi:hypothetical protein